MSTFNFNGEVKDARIFLGGSESVSIRKLSVEIDGKTVIKNTDISMLIENNILKITTKP